MVQSQPKCMNSSKGCLLAHQGKWNKHSQNTIFIQPMETTLKSRPTQIKGVVFPTNEDLANMLAMTNVHFGFPAAFHISSFPAFEPDPKCGTQILLFILERVLLVQVQSDNFLCLIQSETQKFEVTPTFGSFLVVPSGLSEVGKHVLNRKLEQVYFL